MLKTVQLPKTHLMAALVTLTLVACKAPGVPAAVTSVTVVPDSGAAQPNQTRKFKATVAGTGNFATTVTWSSSDKAIATVDADGTVHAIAVGKATITATSTADTKKSGSAALTVATGNTVTRVVVAPTKLALNAGASGTLTATVEGTGSISNTVTWSSDDPAVATVAQDGTVTARAAGQAIITATSTSDTSKKGSAEVTVGSAASGARLSVTNPDGLFPTWMSFNKVDRTKDGSATITQPSAAQHTISTVKLSNTGTDSLLVTPAVTGNFVLPDGANQLTIAPGQSATVRVQFTGSGDTVQTGTLTLGSNDPTAPKLTLTLAGAWQPTIESNPEPTTSQLINQVLGFKTAIPDGTAINKDGQVYAQGDEVISPYWQRANTGQPVNVWQIASYHTINNAASLYWFPKSTSKSAASSATGAVLTSAGSDAQSLFPRSNGDATKYARADVTPAAGVNTFGFRVDNSEWSDPTYNAQSADISAGCTGPCGQHLRFFRAKDPNGAVMPNTYLLIMDYSGINYDYNDNIFLISNVKPAPLLIDTGLPVGTSTTGNLGVTAPDSTVWFSDQYNYTKDGTTALQTYKYFSPVEAYDEPNISSPCGADVPNTANDVLYKTYRGNTSKATPDSRVLTYSIPIENGTYPVTLHFMDMFSSRAGQRVFDVKSGSTTLIPNLDIFAKAGACAAYDQTVLVPVTNGTLSLTFAASADYPAISAIEVNRP
ncbi:uncharacterized protein YjdB [Deinococcus metalli]|uniref:Uncharacterized protein YjdB n=1 Tax=Deinococcus metalli TaxID=1141878 RepID=A0A7W8KD52_9DEIO|nr:Ig-like domain-containing protein [Deinococcus metalli]MBB5375926.1 uncharacterized protein YjdB [Deinococcus metalli]GHF36044.1 hypothetical protein GCM10017781_10770 [Deinococcus metalli]